MAKEAGGTGGGPPKDGRRGGEDGEETAAAIRGTASLIEQLARHTHDLCWTDDMQPAQWSALRYFAMAGTRARTVMGLATFQGTNPATASRTIAVLTRRGLLAAEPIATDRRSRSIHLTEAGYRTLAQDPLKQVEQAVGLLPPDMRAHLGASIERLLASLLDPGGDQAQGRTAFLSRPAGKDTGD